MSLYKENKFKLNINDRTKKILIAVAAFIFVIVLFYLVTAINFSSFGFQRSNISTRFNNSPFVLSKHSILNLEVSVINDSEIDALNSTILIEPIEDIFYINCPNTLPPHNLVEIPIIAKNNKRTIVCDVVKHVETSQILEGTYSFDITYTLNQIPQKQRTTLEIRK
jgi:hypothetical protein